MSTTPARQFTTGVDGYPTDETLQLIEDWPVDDFAGLIEFIRPYFEKHGKIGATDEIQCRLATGGWSGNESIIYSMRDNHDLWSVYWTCSKRGGVYEFVVEK